MHPVLLLLGAGAAGVAAYFTLLLLWQNWQLRKFRGPMPLPLVGNVYSPEALFFVRFLINLRKRYGRIFTVYAFTKPYLVVCDPVVIRRVLSDSKTFYKGIDYSYYFSYVFGEGLVTANGDKHRKDRAVFGKYFVRQNIAKLTGSVNDLTDQAIEELLDVKPGDAPRVHNIEAFFATLSLRVFMKFGFGQTTMFNRQHEKELAHVVSKSSWAVARAISLCLPMWRAIPIVGVLDELCDFFRKEMKRMVDERKAMYARGEGLDMDDCLSAMIRENMSPKDLEDHFITLICAGHDTTAYFSAYMAYLLATNPDAQDRLYAEMTTVLKGSAQVTADHVAEMKYMNLIMQETLRLYSIIPQVTRTAATEVHIKEASITIPKGTNVLIPMFLINRDPDLWENPSQFNPERFADKGTDFTSARNGFFPFGYGTRTCIGNTLAQIESAIFICKLLQRFRFEPEPGFKPLIFSGISLTTSNGINVILRNR